MGDKRKMTKDELKTATGQELIDERNYCGVDGYYGDYLDNVNEEMLRRFNRLAELEKQIEKMKRHCNCKHRDGEGYCEVKRTYLMDISYDGCDKWELED
jgi:hypothetical protein